jgi:tRNA-2-methylthio-N6-dimethylallyladenosine synthase
VNSYKSKIKDQRSKIKNTNQKEKIIDFPKLLRRINSIPGKFWIRFLTSHPKDMSNELINTVTSCEKVTEYIHLPVQSGDDEILHRMNRHYTRKHYLDLLGRIRANLRIVSISTDIIVGFPGETKKQFENTKKLMEEVKFDMAYIAQYSPRPGTAAYKLKDNIPREEKHRREKVLTEILKKTALENNKKYLGKGVEVLVESYKDAPCLDKGSSHLRSHQAPTLVGGIYIGKTRTFKNVRFKSKKDLSGQFAKVKITNCTPWGLEGKLVK